jgi:hypothetical protein
MNGGGRMFFRDVGSNVFDQDYSDDEDVDKLNANADVQVDLGDVNDDAFDWKTFWKFYLTHNILLIDH